MSSLTALVVKGNYKVGDRVYFRSHVLGPASNPQVWEGFGVITQIDRTDGWYVIADVPCSLEIPTWKGDKEIFIWFENAWGNAGEFLVLEEIYNSPLYQALKEP